MKLKIKSPHLNNVAIRAAVAELIVHIKKVKKLYAALKYERPDNAKKEMFFFRHFFRERDIVSLEFEFMQNICLPKFPVQEVFFMKRLTSVFSVNRKLKYNILYTENINLFINKIKTNTSNVYIYHEGVGRKSPDAVY